MRSLLAAGRDGEYRRGFAEMIHRFDQTGVEQTPTELVIACYLPPEKSPDRDRWVRRWEKQVKHNAKAWHEYQYLANAYFRAARFAEAERALRQAIELDDNVQTAVLWASTAFLPRPDGRGAHATSGRGAARQPDGSSGPRRPKRAGCRCPVRRARPISSLCCAKRRRFIAGRDPGADPDEPALRARAQEWLGQLNRAEDHFARLVRWSIPTGLGSGSTAVRCAALGRWDEAGQAFARAVELGPRSAQVWSERGRAYAALGKWDEAATDFVHALSRALRPTSGSACIRPGPRPRGA